MATLPTRAWSATTPIVIEPPDPSEALLRAAMFEHLDRLLQTSPDGALASHPRLGHVRLELGIAEVTLYKWRRQALIDAGRRPGAKSFEADPLLQARRRTKKLKAATHAAMAA